MGLTDGSSVAFYNVIKYGKFAMLTFLLILAFINGHKEYIKERPRLFVWDSFVSGLVSALAITYIARVRGYTELVPNLAFIAFSLFFVYNVFRELSGINTGGEGLTQGEEEQKRKFLKPAVMLAVSVAFILILLALIAHRGHPTSFTALVREGVVFGLLTAIGEAIIVWNHEHKLSSVGKAMGANLVFFFFAHLLLQFGGFYDHVFPMGRSSLN